MYKPQYPGLYYFDNFTFTSLGASGHEGPESSRGYANAPWRPGEFSIQDGQQYWTVPTNGTYQITAAGAYGTKPGRVVTGQVNLGEGQQVRMLVGQCPTPLTANVQDNVTVGGGGGTWISTGDKLLMVASGGDGGSYKNEGYDERNSFADPSTLFVQISVSSDGTTMAGLTFNVNTFAVTAGIYTYTNGFWVLKTTLDATLDPSKSTIIKMSGNGKTIAVCTVTVNIQIFELQNDGTWQKTTIPDSYSSIDLSYDGTVLLTNYPGVYTAGTSWSTLTPLTIPVIGYYIEPAAVAISGDGQTLCVGFNDGSSGLNNLYVYDGIGGTPILLETGPGESPSSISCSYDGLVIATVDWAAYTYYPRVRVFINRLLSKTFQLTGQTYANTIVQLTSDGSKLLVIQSFQVSIDDTVLSTRVNQFDFPVGAMNADGSRIVSSYVSLATPGLFTYNYTTGPSPATFLPSGGGQGVVGAGYLTDGEATNPYFNFFKPKAYIDGGFGNQYEYGSVPYRGGFGGGQSPLNKLTGLTSVTGYKQVRPTLQFSGFYNVLESFAINQDGTLFLLKTAQPYVNVYTYQDSSWVMTSMYTGGGYPNAVNNVAMSLQGDVWLLGGDVWRNGTFETHLDDTAAAASGTYPRRICETSISSDGNVVAICTTSSYCNVYMYSTGTWSKTLSVPIAYLDFYVWRTPGCALSGDGKTLCVEFRVIEQPFAGFPITNFVYTSKYANGSWSSPVLIFKELDDPTTNNPYYCQVDVNADGSKIISVNGNFEYSNGVFSPLISSSLKFSKTDPNAYAYTDGDFIYAPFASLKIKVNLNHSNFLLDFGSSILAVSDSGNYSPQNIFFVDMYDPTTTCTASTSVDHGYPHDYVVQITGTTYFDGTWPIVTTSSNTFTFQAFGGPSVTSGYVSGIVTGISGGGGYTGSPGDGVSGATCYADASVTGFTDLGAASNSSGYVTVSLIDPVPLQEITSFNPWAIQPTVFAPTTTWSSVAYGNGVYVSVSDNGTFPVMYSTNGIDWLTTTTGADVAPWKSVTFGDGKFVAVTQLNVMYSVNGINWTSINNTTGYEYFSTNLSAFNSLVTNSDGSVVVTFNSYEGVEVYKNESLLYTLPEYSPGGATNYDGTVVSVRGNVYTNGTLTHSYGDFYGPDMNADGTMFVFDTNLGYVSVYETVNLLYSIPVEYYYFLGAFMNADGTIVTICNYNEILTYINGILTYTTEYIDRGVEDPVYFAVSKDGTTTVVNSYTFELGFFVETILVYKNGVRIHKILLIDNDGLGPFRINYDGTVFTTGYQRYVNGVLMYTEPAPPSYGESDVVFALSWDAKVFMVGAGYLDNTTRVYQYLQLTPVAYWKSVSYGNELFVSLATEGESMYSTDASSWVYGNTVSVSSLTSLTYGNNKFVAVGTSNVVYSLDGYIWSNVTTGTTSNSWTSVSYGNGRFVVVSSNATSMYSLNGIDWTTGGSPGVSSNCLAYGDGYFACPSSNSEVSAVSISVDGQTWQTIPLTYTGAAYSGITYGDRGFVAISSTGRLLGFIPTFWVNPTQVANSTKLNSRNWSSLTYGNGSFVAVGQGLIQTTQDYGNTWSAFAVSNTLASVTYSSDLGTFLALPGFFGDGVYTSTDGLTWNLSQTLPSVPSAQTSVAYGDGKFVALLNGDSNVFYSRDGINWNVTTSNVGASRSVAYGNQTFAAVSNCITSYSSDAINWTSEEHTAPDYSFSFYDGNSQFAMSSDGSVVCNYGTVYINGVFAYYLPCDGGVAINSDGSIIAVGFSGTICVYKYGILENTIYRYAMKLEMNSDGTIIGGSDSYYEVQIYTNGILSYTLPTTQSSFGLNGDGTIVATHYQLDTLHVYRNGNFLYSIQTEGSGGIDGSIIKLSSDGTILAHSTDNSAVDVSVFKYSTLLYKINSQRLFPRFAMSSDGSLIMVAQFYWSSEDNLGPIMYRNGEFLYQIQVPNEEYRGQIAMSSDGSVVGWNDFYSNGVVRVYNGFLFYQWSSVTYGNGLFVAVANPGGSMYSSDGVNWLAGNAPVDTWTSVSYGDGFFVAVSDNGTYPVVYSQDGINWSTIDPGSQFNNWGSVASGDGTFLVIPKSGATTMTTTVSKTF